MRPGFVETSVGHPNYLYPRKLTFLLKMASAILSPSSTALLSTKHKEFLQGIADRGEMVKPENVGFCIANLALHAGKDMSGAFVAWSDEQCKEFRRNKV